MTLVISDEQIEFNELEVGDVYFHRDNFWTKITVSADSVLGTAKVLTDEFNLQEGVTKQFTKHCTVNIVIDKS
jgi:hypothetical protein